MARASREFAIPHLAQHAAQRLFGDDDAEFLENPLAKIDDPPAHDPVNRRDWAALDDRGERGAMRLVQPRRLPRRLAEAFGVREDTVRFWRSEFMNGGVEALETRPLPGPEPVKTQTEPGMIFPKTVMTGSHR